MTSASSDERALLPGNNEPSVGNREGNDVIVGHRIDQREGIVTR
jgi:hypothetical protein